MFSSAQRPRQHLRSPLMNSTIRAQPAHGLAWASDSSHRDKIGFFSALALVWTPPPRRATIWPSGRSGSSPPLAVPRAPASGVGDAWPTINADVKLNKPAEARELRCLRPTSRKMGRAQTAWRAGTNPWNGAMHKRMQNREARRDVLMLDIHVQLTKAHRGVA